MKTLCSWALQNICEERRTCRRTGRLPEYCLLLLVCGFAVQAQDVRKTVKGGAPLPDIPEATSPVTLSAVNDPVTGKSAFSFDGKETPPVIRSAPGSKIEIEYVNRMSRDSKEVCVDGPCMNMTNLHFHGLHVSPNAPQDDVISMMAVPGQSLRYIVDVPLDQPPGLYWYHTHPHGESYQQDLDGMSGAIVIDGMERYVPEVRHMRERILVLRDQVIDKNDPAAPASRRSVDIPATGCSAS